jgi:hypothetical protein
MSIAFAPDVTPSRVAASSLRYAFLLGRGRSGTTWIGQILNRYPGCHYKYEPFNRDKPAAYRQWLADLPSGDDAELRRRFDALMRGCDHNVDYPPFVVKPLRRQPRALLRATWQAGKIAPALRGLYERYGRPSYHAGDWALTKQVNFPNEHLARLDAVLAPHLLAIVRNPFASVSSTFRFTPDEPSGPLRTDASVARVVELLPSVARFGVPQPSTEELWAMSEAAFEAIRWRVQSEPLADFVRRSPRGLLMSHEDFAGEPETAARRAYAFFGWPFDGAVTEFVQYTTGGDKNRPGASASKRQHSIHRDPADAVRRWKRDLSDEQVADIRSVVAGSALLDLWPGLLD